MKVKFSSDLIVWGKRKETILDMLQKGESHRTENNEVFDLRYRPDGSVRIFMTDVKSGGLESWASVVATVKGKAGAVP
jgi:hypothetical protein